MDSKLDDKQIHRVNLNQYRRESGRWQFLPVAKSDGKPNPWVGMTKGQPVEQTVGGTLCLDW